MDGLLNVRAKNKQNVDVIVGGRVIDTIRDVPLNEDGKMPKKVNYHRNS